MHIRTGIHDCLRHFPYRRGREFRFLLAVLCVGACERPGGSRGGPAADAPADSNGIPIIQLRGEDTAPIVELEGTERTAIGAEADNGTLFRVVGAHLLAGNLTVVGNRGTNQLVLLDSLGRKLGTIGRQGRGPGEFVRLSSILDVGGDTIAAFDGQLRRISILTPAGELVRDYVIQPPGRASIMGLAGAVGAVEDGKVVIWLQTMPSEEEIVRLNIPDTVVEAPLILFVVDSAGRTTSVIGEFPGVEVYMGPFMTPAGELVAANWGPAPFGRWTGFGVYHDRAYVFSSATADFRVYALDGRLISIYRGMWPTRNVTGDDRRRIIDEWMDRFSGWGVERRKKLEQVHYPETMPPYRDAVLGTDGIVWIEPYADWNGQRRLFVGYDSTGLAIGKLSFDYDDRILEIGDGRVILLHVSEDGVETIRPERYRF